MKIKGALGQIQKQKKYTYQTMRKLMFELLRMVEFLEAYKAKELRINGPLVEGTIRTLLRKTAKKAAQEVNERSVKKFSNVPSLYQVAYLRKDVLEMLDKFSHIGFDYNEYLCLVLFVIHSESNCRIGALLDLEYSSYAEMEQDQIRTTFDHKTGSKLPNFLRFRSQTKRLVDQLHEKFREEFNKEPLRTFPSSTNKRFSCQATYLKAALAKFFSITDKSYNPDNVRKAWDSYKVKANFLPEENLARLYQMNTGHCEATRDKYYVQPATDGEIAKLLDNQLDLINDPESCYVTEDDPPKAVPETANEPNVFEEDAEEGDHDHNPACEGLEHQKTALTDDFDETDENGNICTTSCEPGPSNGGMQPSSSEMEAVQMENPQTKGPVKRHVKQTTGEDDARWYAIHESLMKFRGADPLQPHLVKLFDIVCEKKKYLSRRELRLERKHFPGL